MTNVMPQEIEVWYLIPALRKEIAKILIKDNGYSQKQVANILGITEAAVSQYINKNRGKEIKFTKEELSEIKKTSEKIVQKQENVMGLIYQLCLKFRGSEAICNIHRKSDPSLPKNCKLCEEIKTLS